MYQGYYSYPNYQPFMNVRPHRGLGSLFHRNQWSSFPGVKPKFDWGNFLSNTQKTLNVVNQAIPIFYQIKPIWNNAKTMFRIVGALKDDPDDKIQDMEEKKDEVVSNASFSSDNNPQFFL